MTAPLFVPPRLPSERTETERRPRVIRTPFGDGYVQRAVDGLNADLQTATLVWTGLTRAEAAGLEAFFAARQGVEAFRWTPPWDDTERLWLAPSWSRSFDKPYALFNARIEEVPA